MIGAMGLGFAACEPTLIDGPEPYAPVESTVLADGITYTQYADEACTQPDPNGNFVKFSSAAGVVQVFVEGGSTPLYTGAGGVVKLPARRGQEPKFVLYFRIMNSDGSITECSKEFGCTPPTELSPEMLMLVGDTGLKVWKYSKTTDVWGNAGHTGDPSDYETPGGVAGWWWGVDNNETFVDQAKLIPGGQPQGDEDLNAYMVFSEEGKVTSYTPTGNVVRSGAFEVKNYDPTRSSGWEIGKLITPEPATLFPWSINGTGAVKEFDIMYLSPQDMTLVYTEGATPGDWGTITHWRFVAGSPDQTTIAGKWTYTDKTWHEGGHTGDASGFTMPYRTEEDLPGWWWGHGPDGLADKTDYTGGTVYGDQAEGAYMVFEGNTVTTYSPDGEKVRGGTWEAVMNDFALGGGRGEAGWELGKLKTSEPALLFPWSMCDDYKGPVTEYDIMYFDGHNMTLVYTNGVTPGDWDRITYWTFKRMTE